MFVQGQDRVGGFYGRYAGRNAELKFHDVDVDDAAVATTGTIQTNGTINVIPQGVTEITRVGRKCTIRGVHWRYTVKLPEQDAGATPNPGGSIRVILYLDKQCNGTTAAVLDILESTSIRSFRNLSNSGRFVILCDKLHNVSYAGMASDNAGVVSQGARNWQHTFNKAVNTPLEFDAASGAIGTIRSNNFGILLISEVGAMSFTSKIRLRFSDS